TVFDDTSRLNIDVIGTIARIPSSATALMAAPSGEPTLPLTPKAAPFATMLKPKTPLLPATLDDPTTPSFVLLVPLTPTPGSEKPFTPAPSGEPTLPLTPKAAPFD